ncbi:MAG: hypothetical protein WAP35_03335 [Solirubrobacterales bacterium]
MKRFGYGVRVLAVLSLALLLAFVAVGCGDDKDGGGSGSGQSYEEDQTVGEAGKVNVDSEDEFDADQRAVVDKIGEFADATEAKDYKKICNEILTKESRQIGGNCVDTFTKTGADIKDFKITVKSVDVAADGKSATANADTQTNGQAGPQQSLSLVKDSKGEWRVTILGQ